MRAAFITGYGDNSVVGYREIADPSPGADEALIEMRAAGTNPVEISMREGHFKATLPFSFPQVMGYDIAGVVASAPTGSAFKAGDEVSLEFREPLYFDQSGNRIVTQEALA